jgi:hypothetical protein
MIYEVKIEISTFIGFNSESPINCSISIHLSKDKLVKLLNLVNKLSPNIKMELKEEKLEG